MAVDAVVAQLKSMSKQVTTPEEISQVIIYLIAISYQEMNKISLYYGSCTS